MVWPIKTLGAYKRIRTRERSFKGAFLAAKAARDLAESLLTKASIGSGRANRQASRMHTPKSLTIPERRGVYAFEPHFPLFLALKRHCVAAVMFTSMRPTMAALSRHSRSQASALRASSEGSGSIGFPLISEM